MAIKCALIFSVMLYEIKLKFKYTKASFFFSRAKELYFFFHGPKYLFRLGRKVEQEQQNWKQLFPIFLFFLFCHFCSYFLFFILRKNKWQKVFINFHFDLESGSHRALKSETPFHCIQIQTYMQVVF